MSTKSHILLRNESGLDLVVISFPMHDTVQLVAFDRVELDANSASTWRQLDIPESQNCHFQVFRLGLFGLISPRTRLSSGFGFVGVPGESYVIRSIPADEQGNLCEARRVNSDGSTSALVPPLAYRLGDMILRPAVRTIAMAVANINLDGNIFSEHMTRRRAQRRLISPEELLISDSPLASSAPSPSSTSPVSPFPPPPPPPVRPPPSDLTEREIWGVFFEQAYEAGVWARRRHFISEEDLAEQAAYLFIGIPALALCDFVCRSLDDPDGLVLIDGRRVVLATCPSNFRHLYGLLSETKESLRAMPVLTDNERVWIQQILLFAGCPKEIRGNFFDFCVNRLSFRLIIFFEADFIPDTRKDDLRRAFSHISAVATELTQMAMYKVNFISVLDAVTVN